MRKYDIALTVCAKPEMSLDAAFPARGKSGFPGPDPG
jgi:hypothetical protein